MLWLKKGRAVYVFCENINIKRSRGEGGGGGQQDWQTFDSDMVKKLLCWNQTFLQVRMIHVRDLTDYMRSHICSNWIMAINFLFFFLSLWLCVWPEIIVPSFIKSHHIMLHCTGAHTDELIFLLWGNEKRMATVFQPSMYIHHWAAFLLFVLIMKPISIYTVKRVRPGTSAACEGNETNRGPWETRPRSALSVKKLFFKLAMTKKRDIILFSLPTLHVSRC